MPMWKLKKYKPTRFMAKDSYYDKDVTDSAVAFVENLCPALSKRVKILESRKRLIYLPTNSFYQMLSADVQTGTVSTPTELYSTSCTRSPTGSSTTS